MSLLGKEIPTEVINEINESYNDCVVQYDLGSEITEFTVSKKISFLKQLSETPTPGVVLDPVTFKTREITAIPYMSYIARLEKDGKKIIVRAILENGAILGHRNDNND